jgi:hypothetical protein
VRRAVGCLALMLVTACERDRSVPPIRITSSETARPAAPAAPLAGPSRAVRCLSAREIAEDLSTHFKVQSELAVVRVAPDDVLWLRKGPGAGEKAVGKLAHDERGIRATGGACRAGDATWLEVLAGGRQGWADAGFLLPATEPRDETARFAKLLGGARFSSASAVVETLRRALEQQRKNQVEPGFRAELVGATAANGASVALLYLCCEPDDSVLGEQVWLHLHEEQGAWRLDRARVSRLCPRGTSGELCL